MEKYLPEWFNEAEFETFLSEGSITRQAWTKGLQRWRRTKFMLRNMIGKTPMKYVSRMMRNKHAIMARTAIQNARDIQAAQNREEDIQARRNFIRQEQVDVNFDEFLSEKLFSGSQTAFNLGTKPSAGERASMRNPTGDPKRQARLKKREQRKDDKKYSTEELEPMDSEDIDSLQLDEARRAAKERKPVPARKATKTLAKPDAKRKRNVRTPDKPQAGKNDKPKQDEGKSEPKVEERPQEDEGSPTELAKKGIVSKVVVAKTKNGDVKILSADSVNPAYHTIIYPEKGKKAAKNNLEAYLDDPNFVATKISNLIFKGDERAKPKTRKTSEEETTRRTREGVSTRRDQPMSDEEAMQWYIYPPDPNAMMRKGPNPKAIEAQNSVMLSQLVMDPKISELLGKKGFLTPEDIQTYNQLVQANPHLVKIGDESRQEMFAVASQANPALAGKELVALSSMDKRGCIELSEEHLAASASDSTPKADIFIVSKDDMEELVDYLNGKNCGKVGKDLRKKVFAFSYKKGFAQLASSQASETLATVLTVQNMIKEVNNGEFPPKISLHLNKLVENLKKIQQIAKNLTGSESGGTINVNDPAFTVNAMKKMTEKDVADRDESLGLTDTGRGWSTAYNFNAQVQPVKEEIQRNLEELMRNFMFRKAMVYAMAGGGRKYGENSLGRADGIFMSSRDGTPLDTILIPETFQEALNNEIYSEKLDELTSVTRGDFRAKTRPIKRMVAGQRTTVGQQTTPASLRMERMPVRSLELQSYEPEKLDKLFEYTFQPPDITITTMAPDSGADIDSDATQMQSFSSYSGDQTGENIINKDNILEFLYMGGMIDSISFDPVDFEELGLKTKSMGSAIVNKVTVNGVDFEIPVVNTGLDEALFINYDLLNSYLVEKVNEGLDLALAQHIFNSEIQDLITEKYKRDYKREYSLFHGKPEQRAKRSKRVLARRKMAKKFGKKAINGKDIDHKNGNALDNSNSNLRIRSINKNRADNGHSKKRIAEKVNWLNNLEGSGRATLKRLMLTPGQYQNIDPKLLKLLLGNEDTSK